MKDRFREFRRPSRLLEWGFHQQGGRCDGEMKINLMVAVLALPPKISYVHGL